MKYKLSKLALAAVMMHGTITIDGIANGRFIQGTSTLTKNQSKAYLPIRFGINSAHARCGENTNVQCEREEDAIEIIEVTHVPPDQLDPFMLGWNFYTFEVYDGFNNFDGAFGSASEQQYFPIMDEHTKQDVRTTLAAMVTELIKLRNELRQSLTPAQYNKLSRIISGLNQLTAIMNSAGQITQHLLDNNMNAAIADALGFIAGLAPTVGLGAAAASGTAAAIGILRNISLGDIDIDDFIIE